MARQGQPNAAGYAALEPMTSPRTLTVYTDYKSPYAYLAKDLAYELERDFPIRLDWRPYILDIPSYLGSATVDP
ncbi:MAG: hypothetical protein QOD93_5104, partial [Acetobacteraceae bacterium]|nr:hypothetical protein [Acetobacteraceae bacterium]